MCGILLYLGKNKLSMSHPALEVVSHRGPDASNMKIFSVNDLYMSFGHKRLSIIDLSMYSDQPMQYQNSEKWITYNGEIHNYLELRDELKQHGYQFNTTSDTEVLLAAYDKWGTSCLNKFNGMFSFCIWDDKNKILFFARDRYGIKPLYYWNSPKGLAIVSEIKQLQHIPGFQSKLNLEPTLQFLYSGDFAFDESTMWQEVYELNPGECVEFSLERWKPGNHLDIQTWYNVEEYVSERNITTGEAVEEFKSLLDSAVKIRLQSDVKVGALVSGGIDSSSVACIGAKHYTNHNKLQTFSACYNEAKYNELRYLNYLQDIDGMKINKRYFHPDDMLKTVDSTIYYSDLPTIGRSVFSHHLLYRTIHENGIKVALEGQGADEILAGYVSFSLAYFCELAFKGQFSTLAFEVRRFNHAGGAKLSPILKQLTKHLIPNVYYHRYFGKDNKLGGLFKKALHHRADKFRPVLARERSTLKSTHQSRLSILRSILHNVDRCSMASSIETRVPFLDHRLVEFCLSLPSKLKVRNGYRKYILRESVRGVVPDHIRLRVDKMGFSSPEGEWARDELKQFYYDRLTNVKEIPFINYEAVIKGFDQFIVGNVPYNPIFWRLISLSRWIKLFNISIA